MPTQRCPPPPCDIPTHHSKRFSVFGIIAAQVWSRWDLFGPYTGSSGSGSNTVCGSSNGFFDRLTRPRVGCGLALGDVPPGCALLSAARLPALLVRPLSYSFKSSLPLSSALRLKVGREPGSGQGLGRG